MESFRPVSYTHLHDELRKLYARSPDAKARGCKAGDFSYNTGSLRCPGCDGTGVVSLDVQFLSAQNGSAVLTSISISSGRETDCPALFVSWIS